MIASSTVHGDGDGRVVCAHSGDLPVVFAHCSSLLGECDHIGNLLGVFVRMVDWTGECVRAGDSPTSCVRLVCHSPEVCVHTGELDWCNGDHSCPDNCSLCTSLFSRIHQRVYKKRLDSKLISRMWAKIQGAINVCVYKPHRGVMNYLHYTPTIHCWRLQYRRYLLSSCPHWIHSNISS